MPSIPGYFIGAWLIGIYLFIIDLRKYCPDVKSVLWYSNKNRSLAIQDGKRRALVQRLGVLKIIGKPFMI